MGLLGLDPRTIRVLPRLPDDGFFPVISDVVEMFSPRSSPFFGGGMGVPLRVTYFLLLYSSALTVLRPRVGSIFTRLIFVPSV